MMKKPEYFRSKLSPKDGSIQAPRPLPLVNGHAKKGVLSLLLVKNNNFLDFFTNFCGAFFVRG